MKDPCRLEQKAGSVGRKDAAGLSRPGEQTMNYDPDPVDGFSDTQGGDVDPADKGVASDAPKPLSPEEYAQAQKEAREED
ncbi:hypothetical protein BH11ARM2_BH11ARM2_38940 [soil metagenome]